MPGVARIRRRRRRRHRTADRSGGRSRRKRAEFGHERGLSAAVPSVRGCFAPKPRHSRRSPCCKPPPAISVEHDTLRSTSPRRGPRPAPAAGSLSVLRTGHGTAWRPRSPRSQRVPPRSASRCASRSGAGSRPAPIRTSLRRGVDLVALRTAHAHRRPAAAERAGPQGALHAGAQRTRQDGPAPAGRPARAPRRTAGRG